jgi:hypothetical protein
MLRQHHGFLVFLLLVHLVQHRLMQLLVVLEVLLIPTVEQLAQVVAVEVVINQV